MRAIGLALLSGILLAFAFPPYHAGGLILVGFVPLLFAVEGAGKLRAWALGTLAGMVQALIAFAWLVYMGERFMSLPLVLAAGFAVLTAFLVAQQLALVTLFLGVIRRQLGVGPLLGFPVLLVTAWTLYPNTFFFSLATSISPWPFAIQGAEIFGASGVDLVLALANALVFTLLRRPRRAGLWPIAATSIVLVAWATYGVIRARQWSAQISALTPRKIGVVQPHRPSRITPTPPEAHPYELDLSEGLVAQGAELVIWPEGRTHFYDELPQIRPLFHRAVDRLGVPLIFNDKGPNLIEDRPGRFNGAHLLVPGKGLVDIYHKRKLVPFGEYIPVVRAFDFLRAFHWGIWPGSGPKVWTLDSGLRVVPGICYELLFGDVLAEGIGAHGAGKLIVVLSNDGWYGDGGLAAQHNAAVPLRAVENRVPVVHVVNDGPSTVATADGRVIWTSPQWVRGAWVVAVPWSAETGGTFYSRHPAWFRDLVVAAGLLLLLAAGVRWRWGRRTLTRTG